MAERAQVQAGVNKALREGNDLAKAQATVLDEQLATTEKITDSMKSRLSTIDAIVASESKELDIGSRLSALTSKRKEVEDKISDIQKKYNISLSVLEASKHKGLTTDLKALETQEKKLKTQKFINDKLGQMDSLIGGVGSKLKNLMLNPMTAALAIIVMFSGNLDAIGAKIGSMGIRDFAPQLMAADAEMAKLGYSTGEAEKIATNLTSQFGANYDKAIDSAAAVGDMSKALGLSTDEGVNLVRAFSKLGKLSYDQAITLSKQTALMAKQEGVAPHKVLKDIAQSGEEFAKFMKDGGANIGAAAIQARQLGTTIGGVAKIAESLLNFDQSIEAEMNASVMLGKQLNFQRARELALAGDLDGMMENVLSQLGDEAAFNELNMFQRKALADSIGVSVEQMAKFVGRQERAATLAGQISAQKGFEELVGKDAISNIAELINMLKSMAATIVAEVGPSLNFIVGIISSIVGFINDWIGIMPALITTIGIMGAKSAWAAGKGLIKAVTDWWGAGAKMAAVNPLLIPVGIGLAVGAVAKMMSSINSVPKAQHGAFAKATAGGTMMNIAEAGVDEFVIPEPKLASLMNQDTVVAAVEKVAANVALNTEQRQAQQENLWGFGGTVANQIGGATTSAIQASTGL